MDDSNNQFKDHSLSGDDDSYWDDIGSMDGDEEKPEATPPAQTEGSRDDTSSGLLPGSIH